MERNYGQRPQTKYSCLLNDSLFILVSSSVRFEETNRQSDMSKFSIVIYESKYKSS